MRCIDEARSCHLLVAYHEPGEEWKGAFVEDDLYVSITHSFNHHENEARGIFAIPKTAIRARDRLHSVP